MKSESTYPDWQGPAILLMDLDAFFASVEQLDHPEWRGKPVIVGGDPTKRGVVSTASYEARTFGVHSAMPSSSAAKLCPDAIWTHGHFDRYRTLSAAVMDILLAESPHLQQVSIDEAFLDISPTPHNTEHPISVARRIQRNVAKLGITCSIGLGTSKAIAKTASDMDKPRGLTVVYPGREAAFLDPLPTKVMSGIGPVAQTRLRSLGITTLGHVAHANDDILTSVFGKNAQMMRNRCLGIDTGVRDVAEPVKSVSNELSFEKDLVHKEDLEAAITTVASKVGRRLRKKNLEGWVVVLKLRYGDRSLRTMQCHLDKPSANEFDFIPKMLMMLDKLWVIGEPVRLVGCSVTGFDDPGTEHAVQESLFDEDFENRSEPELIDKHKREGLVNATDKVRDRFGENAVMFGGQIKTHGNVTGTAPKNPEDYLR